MTKLINRRNFITLSSLAAGSVAITQNVPFAPVTHKLAAGIAPVQFAVFSKNLQWLNYDEMANAAAEIGFNAIDLTVRPKGHVSPENVETDLPRAVKAIRKAGLQVNMITTGITNSKEPYTERILATAANLGIKYYRLGWFDYDNKTSITQNIDRFTITLKELEKLNRQHQIHGDYQNHAGINFGSAVLDLYMALKDINPEYMGCQYDIRHATVEGANSWPVGFALLKNHIKTINLKDFEWQKKDNAWKAENVPFGKGMIDVGKYLSLLYSIEFNGPVCLHYEYALGGAEDGATKLTVPAQQVYSAMKSDLATAKKAFQLAGYTTA